MKKIIILFACLLIIGNVAILNSCKKKVEKGQVTFWNDTLSQLGVVTVLMSDGTSGNITVDNATAPACGASGCFTFSALPDTYTYKASDAAGHSWSGSVTITEGGCKTVRLYK
ncbi:MAG: hypothetical protein WC223_12200 [Bacteroidales bacterium]|jgi:hypothetical protein